MNVPDERIKTITASCISPFEGHCREEILYEIARGIIDKLREFNKIKIEKMSNGYYKGSCYLDIIVPPRVVK